MHHYPGMIPWWLSRAAEAFGEGPWSGAGAQAGCGPSGARESHRHRGGYSASHEDWHGGSGLGVRRPLRFLAYKLDLDEAQVAQLAQVLSELKTERAQGEVDQRLAHSACSRTPSVDSAFDSAKGQSAGELRVQSAERLRQAVVRSLERIHAILSDEQRAKLAYLIRTGTLTL